MKKKAIIAIPYLSGKGGTETVIKNFHQALSAYGNNEYMWELISYGGTKYPAWMKEWNKKVYNFSNSRLIQKFFYIFLLPFLIGKDLKKEKPDYFIATNPIIWTLAFYQRKVFSPKTKIISWYHFSFKRKNVNKRYLKTTDYFWAISNGIRKELISLGVNEKNIDVVYNPVNTKNISSITRSNRQNHFIYIGRIDYDGQKNVSELIQALSQVTSPYICDLYGNFDEEIKNKLLNLSLKKDSIRFHGFFKDVWSQINEADVLLLTSKYEGFGMVLCEAASRGIALVSSDCPVGPQEIVNKDNGYLYKSGDTQELTKILNNITSYKVEISSVSKVKKSIEKFNYFEYSKRIINSLNLRVI